MALGESWAGKALLDALLHVLGHLLVALPAPLLRYARSDLEDLLSSRYGEDRSQVCPKLLAPCGRDYAEEVPSVARPGTSGGKPPGSGAR
jgi:hypothetical protein